MWGKKKDTNSIFYANICIFPKKAVLLYPNLIYGITIFVFIWRHGHQFHLLRTGVGTDVNVAQLY